MKHDRPDPLSNVDLDDEHATRLLEMCVTGPWRPIDSAIQRLQRDDGAAWFAERVAVLLDSGEGVTLESLERAKERAKDLMADAATRDDAAVATVCYFLTVATALKRYGRLISSQPPEQLAPVLADLAAALPETWSDLAMEAAWQLE